MREHDGQQSDGLDELMCYTQNRRTGTYCEKNTAVIMTGLCTYSKRIIQIEHLLHNHTTKSKWSQRLFLLPANIPAKQLGLHPVHADQDTIPRAEAHIQICTFPEQISHRPSAGKVAT